MATLSPDADESKEEKKDNQILSSGGSTGYFENDTSLLIVRHNTIIVNEFDDIDEAKAIDDKNTFATTVLVPTNDLVFILPRRIRSSYPVSTETNINYIADQDSWEWTQKKGIKYLYNYNQYYKWNRLNMEIADDVTFIIVVGHSGVGKSSLIKLLTNCDKIDTSNGVLSCTKESTFYYSLKHKLCFLDTRGTSDTDGTTKDTQILNQIQRKIHKYNGNKCKFIWIVENNIRAKGDVRPQAKFISKFAQYKNKNNNNNNNNNNNENIWDSVLLINKQPPAMNPLKQSIAGVIQLAENYDCPKDFWSVDRNLVGFTNIDWDNDNGLFGTKNMLNMVKLWDQNNGSSMHECNGNSGHYYYSHEIKKFVFDKLNKINSFSLFSKELQCTKCGIIGDPEFINDLKCHTIPFKCHPPNCIEYKHQGINQHKIHKPNHKIILNHPSPLKERYHDGRIEYRHTMDSVFSAGGKLAVAGTAIVAGVAGVAATIATGGATVATGGAAGVTTGGATAAVGGFTNKVGQAYTSLFSWNSFGTFPCCGGNLNSNGCFGYYSCCNGGTTNIGCKIYPINRKYYPCCGGRLGSNGCVRYYDCCGKRQLKDKNGYIINNGCINACNNCNVDMNRKDANKKCGYEMKCCGKNGNVDDKAPDTEDGCQKRCNHCLDLWGEPVPIGNTKWSDGIVKQGCCSDLTNFRHDMKPIS